MKDNTKYGRIVLFCDYGTDDAVATLHILSHAHMFERIDIVPIGGNVTTEVAFRNAHTLLAHAARQSDVDRNKVRIIDTRGIRQPSADIPDIHGGDGIGDVLEPMTSDFMVVDYAAFADELQKTKRPERDVVLSLGPCTVPNMLGYVPACTVLMGGATKEAPNYGDYEFNEALDVAAFREYAFVAAAVATLDSCHNKLFGFDTMTTDSEVENTIIRRCVELCKERNAIIAIYDYVAALAVTNPELFEAERIRRADGVEYNELKFLGYSA